MSRRIAIVEDEAAIRENYADVLRKQGYEVQTYANRKDAMAAFDSAGVESEAPALAVSAGGSPPFASGRGAAILGARAQAPRRGRRVCPIDQSQRELTCPLMLRPGR